MDDPLKLHTIRQDICQRDIADGAVTFPQQIHRRVFPAVLLKPGRDKIREIPGISACGVMSGCRILIQQLCPAGSCGIYQNQIRLIQQKIRI